MSRSINQPLWQHLSAEITREMGEWRLAHPKASLREIENELDARLNRLRARLLEESGPDQRDRRLDRDRC
jgi:hypothetical protein